MRPRGGCPPAFLGTPVGFCLHDNPFVYKVRTLNVERRSETITCTIRTGPVYGLEVAILGVQDVNGAQSFINNYIRNRYGDVIAASRIAHNGQAYCTVFKTWEQTSRFPAEPFHTFDRGLWCVSHTRPAHPCPPLRPQL